MDSTPREQKIKSFTDLYAWQAGHELVLMVYKAVNQFPSKEKSILSNQLLRAIISVTSNIAEGFSTASNKSKASYYHIALASLTEAQNQLVIAKDLGYISPEEFKNIAQKSVVVSKLIHGLIKNLNKLQDPYFNNSQSHNSGFKIQNSKS